MPFQRNNSYAVFYPVRGDTVRYFPQGGGVSFYQLLEDRVCLVIDQHSALLYLVDKDPELLQVYLKCGKNVDMIPGDACNNGNMREEKVKFWPLFQGAGRIFVPLAYDDRGLCNVYRLGKALQPGSYQVIEVPAGAFEDIHDHGGGGSLAMAAADHYPRLI